VASAQLGCLAERVTPRLFAVREPRQRVLERLPCDLCSEASTVKLGD